MSHPPPPKGRPRGLWILAALVTVGMGVPAYLQWAVPRLEARRDEVLASAPSEPEGMLARWFEFGQPRVHEALTKARFSADQPWFVTHLIAPVNAEEAPRIWGIDFTDIQPDVIALDGLTVRVVLEAPRLLGRDVLVGDRAMGVPVFQPGAEIPDPRRMAKERLERYLGRVGEGLARDIDGARLAVEVGGLR